MGVDWAQIGHLEASLWNHWVGEINQRVERSEVEIHYVVWRKWVVSDFPKDFGRKRFEDSRTNWERAVTAENDWWGQTHHWYFA